jgi:hypothetical protein
LGHSRYKDAATALAVKAKGFKSVDDRLLDSLAKTKALNNIADFQPSTTFQYGLGICKKR